jgi:hypothetical protein
LLARAQALDGRLEPALAYFEPLLGQVGHELFMAAAFVKAGRRDVVEGFLTRHTEPFRLSLIHAALGNKDLALTNLLAAVDRQPHRVALALSYPELDSLRDDPRFDAIRARLNLR